MMFILPRITIERWKYNKEYQLYVSNMGHIKDKKKRNLTIKISSKGGGYVTARFDSDGIRAYASVHSIVMKTWKPLKNYEGMTVDHIDHNTRNNCLNNLKWVTKEENLSMSIRDNLDNKISFGDKSFDDMDAAIDYIIKEHISKTAEDYSRDKINKKIKWSIKNKRAYCGNIWKRGVC